MTDVNLNFTIIEIIDIDNISYLELDKFDGSRDLKDDEIFSFDYPEGKNLQYLYEKCKGKNNDEIFIFIWVLGGSAIILKYNLKLVGLYKGTYDQYSKANKAISMKTFFNKLNFIKCVYNIDSFNIGKEIQIINKPKYFSSSISSLY